MHSTFAYFGGPTPFAYQYSENSPLRAYPVSSAGLGTAITNNIILGPTGGTGGFLSVSSKRVGSKHRDLMGIPGDKRM